MFCYDHGVMTYFDGGFIHRQGVFSYIVITIHLSVVGVGPIHVVFIIHIRYFDSFIRIVDCEILGCGNWNARFTVLVNSL